LSTVFNFAIVAKKSIIATLNVNLRGPAQRPRLVSEAFMTDITVQLHAPVLRKRSWSLVPLLVKFGESQRRLAISEERLREQLKVTCNEDLYELLNEARRVGVIAYRQSYGVIFLTLIAGEKALVEFEDYIRNLNPIKR
jgi:hypothetical protein